MSAPDANAASRATSNPTSAQSVDLAHSKRSHKKPGKKHAKATDMDVESAGPKPSKSNADDAFGGAGPSAEKVSASPSDPKAPDVKSSGHGPGSVQPASLHESPAVPSNEQRRARSAVAPVVACVAVLLVVAAAAGIGLVVLRRSVESVEPPVSCNPLQNLPTGAVVIGSPVGRLVGSTVSTSSGVNVNHWQGLPYARRPEGQLRFAKPLPLKDSDRCAEVLAVQPSPPCAQWVNGHVLGSEDCLHLNVWAPTAPSNGTRPLVLAAKGHWFQRSTNDVPQWADLAAQGGVVVMAPNVRLGVLGFLHPKKVPGVTHDVAEEDMMVAMRWALDNAASFGANASSLMLAGEGSGAYMLVQAAGRLGLSVSRAVIEGSVFSSAVPANNGAMEPSKELAGRLNCSVKDRSTWFSCFSNATLDTLLSTAAQMELRFAPLWNVMMFVNEPSEKKLPTIKEVVAGTDIAQTKAFIEEYVRPAAKASGNDTTVKALHKYTIMYIIGRDLALDFVLKKLEGKTEKQLSTYLNLVLSGCATRTVARRAVDKGYHYIIDGGDRPLFEPLLGTADVAKFMSDGSVPSLKDGNIWKPWMLSKASRIIKDDGSEVLGSVEGVEFCTQSK